MEIKMITTGQILSENTETFTPIINKLLEIVGELIPYFIYIAIGVLGISLLWNAVKYIMGNLKSKSELTIQGGRETPEERQIKIEDRAETRDMKTIVDRYNELYDNFETGELKGLGHSKMRIYNGYIQEENDTFGGREDAVEYKENNKHGKEYLIGKYRELKRFNDDRF